MKMILDYAGRAHFVSDEVYVITEDKEWIGKDYAIGKKVRLISGVDGSDKPGYHFSDGWVTVCSVKAAVAEFVSMRRDAIRLDNRKE